MDVAELASMLKSSVERKESMEPIAIRIPKDLYLEAKLLKKKGVNPSVYYRYLLKRGREAIETSDG